MALKWDLKKALAHLNKKALNKSIHKCAHYTADAIDAGGLHLNRPEPAREFGPALMSAGFLPLGKDPGVYQPGDVVVIQGVKGHKAGHMAMFNGSIWISDYKQNHPGFYPNDAYRKAKAGYQIYRFPDLTTNGASASVPAD